MRINFPSATHAATRSWTNLGTDFSAETNWTGGIAPTAAPTFQPALATSRSIAGIQFVNGAGASTVSDAGTLSLGAAGIVNNDNSTQTLSLPLRLGLAAPFTTASSGALVISGSVDTNGLALTLNGTGAGVSAISGAISGTGKWTLSGANTYSGGTTINGGTLRVWNTGLTSALGTGAVVVNATTNLTPIVIDITSLASGGSPGNALNFSSSTSYSWPIATFTGNKFVVNTPGFSNPYSGTFGLAVSGNSLVLTYTAIPEPAAWVAIFSCLGSAALRFRSLRRRSA